MIDNGEVDNMPSDYSESNEISTASAKTIATEIHAYYIHEIVVALGCLLRWSKPNKGLDEVVKWIASDKFALSKIKSIAASKKEEVSRLLTNSIRETQYRLDVTAIKASIRTLLHSSQSKRNNLMKFVEAILAGDPSQAGAVKTLRDDLMKKTIELGYPIPIMPQPTSAQVAEINKQQKNPVKLLSVTTTIRKLAIKLNQGELVFDKQTFELGIKNEVLKFFTEEETKKLGDLFPKHLQEGIALGFLNFGLCRKNNGWHKDSNGRDIIDLNNSSPE